MSDATEPPPEDEASTRPAAGDRGGRPVNAFDRLFPGPAPKDPRVAARLDALSRAAERRATAPQRRPSSERRRPVGEQGVSAPIATAEDIERLTDAIHEQTDVVRSLLDADIAIRDDARATAQNSRTFAIAGTVIAFFTLIATVVTVVIAFRG